jgi:hypothetical protein
MRNLFFIFTLTASLFQQAFASDDQFTYKGVVSFHQDYNRSASPSVHDVTRLISLGTVCAADYDLSKFKFVFELDPKSFRSNSRELTPCVKLILDSFFRVRPKDADCWWYHQYMTDLEEMACVYQEIEATAVFYRDIKCLMEGKEGCIQKTLVEIPSYQKHRANNEKIVENLSSHFEGLADYFVRMRLSKVKDGEKNKKESTDREIRLFKAFVNDIKRYKEEFEAMKKNNWLHTKDW